MAARAELVHGQGAQVPRARSAVAQLGVKAPALALGLHAGVAAQAGGGGLGPKRGQVQPLHMELRLGQHGVLPGREPGAELGLAVGFARAGAAVQAGLDLQLLQRALHLGLQRQAQHLGAAGHRALHLGAELGVQRQGAVGLQAGPALVAALGVAGLAQVKLVLLAVVLIAACQVGGVQRGLAGGRPLQALQRHVVCAQRHRQLQRGRRQAGLGRGARLQANQRGLNRLQMNGGLALPGAVQHVAQVPAQLQLLGLHAQAALACLPAELAQASTCTQRAAHLLCLQAHPLAPSQGRGQRAFAAAPPPQAGGAQGQRQQAGQQQPGHPAQELEDHLAGRGH